MSHKVYFKGNCMMNPKELLQKTDKELLKLAQDLRSEVRDFRFKIATRQNTKVRNLRNVKKDLARVLTILNAKRKSVAPVSEKKVEAVKKVESKV